MKIRLVKIFFSLIIVTFSANTLAWKIISLKSFSDSRKYVRHAFYKASVTLIRNNQDKEDASFYLEEGLADSNCFSFRSRNFPTLFLRHRNYRIVLDKSDGSNLFKQDATFCRRNGLAYRFAQSYESYNFPGYYMHHNGRYELFIGTGSGYQFEKSATFWDTTALK